MSWSFNLLLAALCWFPRGGAAQTQCEYWGEIGSLVELKRFGRKCTSLQGDLWIEGTADVTDLEVISDLTSIAGLHLTNNAELTNVLGLRNLRGVVLTGYIWIQNNPKLGSLNGLEGVVELGVGQGLSLYISSNDALTSISGLRGVSGVLPGGVEISINAALLSFDGLEGVTGVDGYDETGASIYVEGNAALRSIAALHNVHGDLPGALVVMNNDVLESTQGLLAIRAAGTETAYQGQAVYILGNPAFCATPDEVSALRTLCATSASYGFGRADNCAPASDAEWWDPSRCDGKYMRSFI